MKILVGIVGLLLNACAHLIEVGKLADLVLLDGNPLTDIRNTQRIRAVVADGLLCRRADLDELRAGAMRLE
jgi:hypothetical protein